MDLATGFVSTWMASKATWSKASALVVISRGLNLIAVTKGVTKAPKNSSSDSLPSSDASFPG